MYTLPSGAYTFTVKYHGTWEGQCGNSYVVAAAGKGLPSTSSINNSLAYTAMREKTSSSFTNKIEFFLEEETQVSLGLLVNITGQQCMAIESFMLERENTEYLEADGLTDIEPVIETIERDGDDAIYDLQGRRIVEPKKGSIYIKNGKKFFAK